MIWFYRNCIFHSYFEYFDLLQNLRMCFRNIKKRIKRRHTISNNKETTQYSPTCNNIILGYFKNCSLNSKCLSKIIKTKTATTEDSASVSIHNVFHKHPFFVLNHVQTDLLSPDAVFKGWGKVPIFRWWTWCYSIYKKKNTNTIIIKVRWFDEIGGLLATSWFL